MKRYAVIAVLASLAFVIQGRSQDQVYHRDAKKGGATQTNGTISNETISAITLKTNLGQVREIPASEISEIIYELRGEIGTDYRRGGTIEKQLEKVTAAAERKKLLDEVIRTYEAVLPKVRDNKFLSRHLQYKLGMLRAKGAVDNKAMADAAIADLAKFKKENANAWQLLTALKTLGQLYVDQGKFDEAATVFDDILKLPGLSNETKAELEMLATRILIQAKKHAEAEKRLNAILKGLPANDAKGEELRLLVVLCQAHTNFGQAVKTLETMIEKSKDPARIALAYNTLGDCYQMNNQPKEALYQYLFVDQFYNANRQEHIRAVESIIKVFNQMKRPERAKEYETQLEELKK